MAINVPAGDFDSAEMKQQLEQKLGSWQGRGDAAVRPPKSPLPENGSPTLHLIDRPKATQVDHTFQPFCTTPIHCFTVVRKLLNVLI